MVERINSPYAFNGSRGGGGKAYMAIVNKRWHIGDG